MSTASTPDAPLPPIAIRNVAVLSAATALLGANSMVHIALGPLAAALMAPSQAWVTAPITVLVLANAFAAAPISMLTGRFGRRPVFLVGVACVATGASLAAYAIVIGSFWLFMAASVGFGVYQACQNLFRFAAADSAPAAFKPKAISYVLAGGLAAAVVGPFIANNFSDALAPTPIAGAYLALVGLCVLGVGPLMLLREPSSASAGAVVDAPKAPLRPIGEALMDRGVATAMLCGAVTYAAMTLVMTSTSTAMAACGHSNADALMVIGVHVVAMFAPSFFTGALIARFGQKAVILTGFALMAACSVVAQTGLGLEPFSISLVLLGVGWNFGFIGATSLLAARHRREDGPRLQAINESLVFGLMALASLASGVFLAAFGWTVVTLSILPMLGLAALALIWDGSAPRGAPA